MALAQREPGADFELVAHMDRGSQYTAADYTQGLDGSTTTACTNPWRDVSLAEFEETYVFALYASSRSIAGAKGLRPAILREKILEQLGVDGCRLRVRLLCIGKFDYSFLV